MKKGKKDKSDSEDLSSKNAMAKKATVKKPLVKLGESEDSDKRMIKKKRENEDMTIDISSDNENNQGKKHNKMEVDDKKLMEMLCRKHPDLDRM